MTTKAYLLIATTLFIAAVTGSDLFARMSIGGISFEAAFKEHLEWASLTVVGTVCLFAPFVGFALICSAANRWARTRSAVALFLISTAGLTYFYFGGFQAAQREPTRMSVCVDGKLPMRQLTCP